MIYATISILVILLLLAGILWLQFHLSKKKNRWLGLILPALFFLFSLINVLSLASYSTLELSVSEVRNTETGVVTKEAQPEHTSVTQKEASLQTWAHVIVVFLISNVPTVVLGGIYLSCRERVQSKKELERMQAQDLE